MDYIATKVTAGESFEVRDGQELWACNQDTNPICFATQQVNPPTINMLDGKVIGYGRDYRSLVIPAMHKQIIPVECNTAIKWKPIAPTTRHSQACVFLVWRDPDYQVKPKMASRPLYDVLGVCSLVGNKSSFIGPLHVPSVRGGRIVVELTDATRTSGGEYGEFVIDTSDDGESWTPMKNWGGPLVIKQNTIHTGDQYAQEISFASAREYLRIGYRSKYIAGPGFKATVTIETKR